MFYRNNEDRADGDPSSGDDHNKDSNSNKYCETIDEFGCAALLESTDDDAKGNKDEEEWAIRLQAGPDSEEIATMKVPDEVRKRIEQVVQDQAQSSDNEDCSLYPREWFPARKRNTNTVFTVAQFNTLAQGLSFGPNAQSPFRPTLKRQERKSKDTYGGFSSVRYPDVCLDFQSRQWRLLEAILEADADVVGLQEIDRFHGFFLPLLKIFGYDGIFLPKSHSPCTKMGWYSDGCALFWRTSMWELVSYEKHQYTVGNQVCLVAQLQHQPTNQTLRVVVTHLKAQKDEACEKVRKEQVEEIVSSFLRAKRAESSLQQQEVTPTVVLGDFNTEPTSDAVVNMAHYFTSAYDLQDLNFFTTYKTRGSTTVQRVIDYIFYSNDLNCTSTLKIPDNMEELPSLRSPSDHILLASQFDFSSSSES